MKYEQIRPLEKVRPISNVSEEACCVQPSDGTSCCTPSDTAKRESEVPAASCCTPNKNTATSGCC